jgi:photosystem II stability/assembly factor-like uncharacterized protein
MMVPPAMARILLVSWTSILANLVAFGAPITTGLVAPAAAAGPWHVQNSGATRPLFDVACTGATRCYAVGEAGTIRSTTNGGATWKRQPNPLESTSTALVRIACPAAGTCYAIGRPRTVLVTHNGGSTWALHTFALSANVTLSAVACLNAATCYIVGGPYTAFLITGAIVLLTTNGGATWTKQSIPPTVPCQNCGQSTVGYPLNWVTCLPNHLCRAGGIKFMDSHSGFTQAAILTLAPAAPWPLLTSNFTPSLATCPSVSRCYGVLTENPFAQPIKVWISVDGGVSWAQRKNPTPRVLNGISCPSTVTCDAVGNTGSIIRTTNGNTFFSESSPTFRNLYGITCATAVRCVAVGNKGAIVART